MKKQLKQTLSLLMSLVMIISMFTGLAISSFAEDDILEYLSYEINDGEVTITGCDTEISGDIVIPDTIEGYPVTIIGDHAFSYCNEIESLEIPDSVTTIGNSAFYWCSSLTSITIPDSVTTIGDSAFYWCSSLTSITIPDSVTTIGDSEFYNCRNLTSITIPDSVTTIGDSAFSSCYSLTSITIPDSVTTIGDSAFSSCYSLTSITIPDSVTTIGDSAFSSCDSLTSITIPDSVTTIGDSAFYWCDSLTSIIIPDSVTTIGDSAFSSCYSLTSITIPDGVTTIGDSAFSGCSDLTSITIGSGVIAIADNAFGRCYGIEKFIVAEDNTVYSSDEHDVLFNKDKTVLIKYPEAKTNTEYIIPDSVTTIGNSAFSGCSYLTSITIPDGVTTIGDSAFSGCNRLEKFIVNNDNVVYSSDENGVLFNKGQTELIMVPASNRIKKYVIPDSVITIVDSAFYECLGLTSITFGKNVKNIGASAFRYCKKLSEIKFSENLEVIDDHAFYGCKNIKSVTIGDSLKTIGYYAFYDCENLEDVTIGDNVTMVGGEAFNKTPFKNNKDNWVNGEFYIGKVLCAITGISGDYEVKSGTETIAPGAIVRSELNSVTFPVSVSRICSAAFADAGLYNAKVNEVIILNPYCIIEPDGEYSKYTISPSAIIKGYKGSTAEEYANNHENKFVKLEGEPPAELNTEKLPTEEYVHKELTTKGFSDPEHDFVGVYVISPTCVEDGVMVYTCYCGKSYEADVKATGHTDSNKDIICDTCNVNINTGEVATTEPTTKEPETEVPTTEPTTKAPETEIPTTEPTTKEPETEVPTTELTTKEPETEVPTTEPTTKEPETEVPTTEPTTKEPETEPTTKEPVTQAPTTEKPSEKPTENPTEKPTQKPVSDKLEVSGNTVKVDNASKVSTVNTKSSANDILKSVKNEKVSIVDKDGKAVSGDALVGTGAKIQIKDNSGKVISTYTVCVPTDVDGNGKTTAADARLALRGSAKLDKVEGVYATASDMNGDGKITAADARMILRISAGLEKA